MSNEILSALGIDPEAAEWEDLALCPGMDPELFFDKYESSPSVARTIDNLCQSCPVKKMCFQEGIDNNEWGVRGGFFLINGKVDKNRNAHKTDEWKRQWARDISE
jgi:hypothetical protein